MASPTRKDKTPDTQMEVDYVLVYRFATTGKLQPVHHHDLLLILIHREATGGREFRSIS